MRYKDAIKIIEEINKERQALNRVGEMLELAVEAEKEVKTLEQRRDKLSKEIGERAKREHSVALTLLKAEHAKETDRMKMELEDLAATLNTSRLGHETSMARFAKEEGEARRNLEIVRGEIKSLTQRLQQSA